MKLISVHGANCRLTVAARNVLIVFLAGHAWIDDVWRIDARLRALDEESDDGDGNSDGVLDVVRDSAEDLGTTTTA